MPTEIPVGQRITAQADAKEFASTRHRGIIEAKGCKPGPCLCTPRCACLPKPPPKCGPNLG